MRDVARRANVSVQTVSNVVNGHSEFVAVTTAARVRGIIEELGFRPNPAARGLRFARADTLAFLVLDSSTRYLADPMTDLFLAGLGDTLRDKAYSLLVRACKPGIPADALLEPLIEGRVDAAVISLSGSKHLRRRYLSAIAPFASSVVLLQEHGRTIPTGITTVCSEDRAGGRELCRHLLMRGHKRIAFLTSADQWSAIEERLRGYRDAHREAGLRVDNRLVRRVGSFNALSAASAVVELLDLAEPPTAIQCGNDLIAAGVAKAARDRGLRIPTDLAIAGFDDFEFAAVLDPPLTTVRLPGYEMGRYAAETLIGSSGQETQSRSRVFPTEICYRAST